MNRKPLYSVHVETDVNVLQNKEPVMYLKHFSECLFFYLSR